MRTCFNPLAITSGAGLPVTRVEETARVGLDEQRMVAAARIELPGLHRGQDRQRPRMAGEGQQVRRRGEWCRNSSRPDRRTPRRPGRRGRRLAPGPGGRSAAGARDGASSFLPATGGPARCGPATTGPATNRPATNRPATNRPATNRPATAGMGRMRRPIPAARADRRQAFFRRRRRRYGSSRCRRRNAAARASRRSGPWCRRDTATTPAPPPGPGSARRC